MITKKKPRQLSREDWTEAACKQLVAAGIEEVKVDRLARKMKVTRGSFYWHFKNRKDLLDSVLRVWEAHKERELQQTRAEWATMGPLEVVRIWLSEDPTYPAFDIAIRFWAWKAPAVAKIVSAIDDRWIAFLAEQFFREGQSKRLSVARARLIYWQQVGYYAMKFEEPMQERLAYMPHYNAILLGNEGGDAADIVVTELTKVSLTKKRAPRMAPPRSRNRQG